MSTHMNRKHLFRINEAADYAAVSRATLYNEIKAKRLSLVKLGHASRIEVSEMDRWIDERAAA